MAIWPTTLPELQKNVIITPGDSRLGRKLQSGRTEFRRFGNGKPDQVKVLYRLTWAQWDIFKEFYVHELNLGLNWFSADWLSTLGYSAHKAKILGYPREVVLQSRYVDVLCNLLIQKTIWIISTDTVWPCLPTGGATPPPDGYGYVYGGNGDIQDCDGYNPNVWTSKTNLLSGQSYLAASTIGNSGYIYGGLSGSRLSCDEYTPDVWVAKTNMPSPGRYGLSASTINTAGYVYGGYDVGALQDCDKYIPDAWVSMSNMIATGRYYFTASTISSSGYILGGDVSSSCLEYTPDVWTVKTNIPNPRRHSLASSTIGTVIYIYGGDAPVGGACRDCDEYTPDVWVSKTDIPLPARFRLSASTIGNSGYIYGGYGGAILRDCDEYTSDTWVIKTDMPTPARYYFAASTI